MQKAMGPCMSISVHPCIRRRWWALRRALLQLLERIHSLQEAYSSVEVNLFSAIALPSSPSSSPFPSPSPSPSLSPSPSMSRLDRFPISSRARRMGVYVTEEGKLSLADRKTVVVPLYLAPKPRPKVKPRRMHTNGVTRRACLFTRRGQKGVNQDAMIVWEGFGYLENTTLCGVFDGHGPHGHRIAQQVRESLPLKLRTSLEALKAQRDLDNLGSKLESIAGNQESEQVKNRDDISREELENVSLWKECFLNACKQMDLELQIEPNATDCFCSGTTAVTLVKQGHDLVIANVGDSRAVLGTISDTGAVTAVQLTVDLKADLPEEAERIKRSNGRIFASRTNPEVQRVWLPNEYSPGLAMSRAFGDFCLKRFGIIAVPQVTYRRLTSRDLFIVLATDGIWDVLSNEQVVQIVCRVPVKSEAAKSIVEYAVDAWRYKYPTSKMDDCAVVCLYIDHPTVVSHNTSKSSSPIIESSSSQGITEKAEVSSTIDLEMELKTAQELAISKNMKLGDTV